MGLFEHWPYTNFHELNLNWIIQQIKKISERFSTIEDAVRRLEDMLEDSEINLNVGRVQNLNTDTAVLQMIYNAAKSYETDAWSIAQHHIDYGNYLTNNPSGNSGTPLDPAGSWTVCNRLDCSAFVILCLMGIPYNATAFNGTNELTPRTTFNRYYKYKPRRNPDGLLRWASDIYEMAESNEMLVKVNSFKDIRTGDVIFFKYTDSAWDALDNNSFAKADGGAYKRVAHVGIAVDNCSAFESGLGIMHCVDTSAVMAFQDLATYNPVRLERVGYVMRPWKIKPAGSPKFTGFTTFRKRGTYTDPDASIAAYDFTGAYYSYTGGRIPSDALTGSIDTSTGEYVEGSGQLVTGFIPYNAGIVIENPLSGTEYRCFYYDGSENFISYTTNTVNRPSNAKLIRLEFRQTNNAPLTPAQEEYLKGHVIIRYHISPDTYSAQARGSKQNSAADTYYYFAEAPDFEPVVNVNN